MLKLDILLLFFLKKHYYLKVFRFCHFINPTIIVQIFGIKKDEYTKFETMFEESMNIL